MNKDRERTIEEICNSATLAPGTTVAELIESIRNCQECANLTAKCEELEKNEKGYRVSVDELYRQGETLRQQIAELEEKE